MGAISDGGDFTVSLFRDGVWGEDYCWKCCSCNFCCRNIFVIVYPWAFVGKQIILKTRVLKVLLDTFMMLVMETEKRMFY